jgi:phage tail sheath gpL-like
MLIAGSMTLNGTALTDATVAFTCGCSAQAGETTTGSNGAYTIGATATAIPASPNPTYTTVPGRNYMIIGYTSSGTQAWTMGFMGDTQAADLNLSSTPTNLQANNTDTASAATALYIYYESQNDSDQSFDLWNFNTIAAWAAKLRAGTSLSTHETQLLSDVSSAQSSGISLYPTVPAWNPQAGAAANATILADLQAVHSDGTAVDPALPTPCPAAGACTGTPTP